ncbi:uncharacterized protein G2W53_003059 [Senna tora]|uniref:Uncharacterized protein n=1 Tax=Senna tora TaxID=362788 RepID=A0A835CFE3_9FABA|nr:uncharacterized protein G2W53_003059 [Senna tora]
MKVGNPEVDKSNSEADLSIVP